MDGKWWGVLLEWTGRGKAYKTDKQKKNIFKKTTKQQNNKAKNKTKQTNKKASNLLVAFILYAENSVTNYIFAIKVK